MNPRRTGFLREVLDSVLDLLLCRKHKVGEFIDDNDDLRKLFLPRRDIGVIFVNIDDICPRTAHLFEQAVTTIHFPDCPVKTLNNLVDIRDDLVDHQMRQMIVNDELCLFRIDKNKSQLVGRIFYDQADNKAAQEHTFTRARSACHQQVGHFADIAVNLAVADILAHCIDQRS